MTRRPRNENQMRSVKWRSSSFKFSHLNSWNQRLWPLNCFQTRTRIKSLFFLSLSLCRTSRLWRQKKIKAKSLMERRKQRRSRRRSGNGEWRLKNRRRLGWTCPDCSSWPFRWEEERYTDGVKWKFLEHKGPVFAPPYEPLPSNVRFYYDGGSLSTRQVAALLLGRLTVSPECFR